MNSSKANNSIDIKSAKSSIKSPKVRLILAPLRGVTSCNFRNVYSRYFNGFDAALTPFITTTSGNAASRNHFLDILPENNNSWEILPQLIGNNPDDFIRTSQQVHDLGYDQVDLNLGCPMPTVTKKMRGSALLSNPERLLSFLDRVIPALPCRLSLKVRLGYQSNDDLIKLVPFLNKYPLSCVTIHARIASQLYSGTVDLNAFGSCLEQLSLPVVYNGDITSVEIFESLKVRFPKVSGWMIGRGAIADPLLPAKIKNLPLPSCEADVIKSFHNELFMLYEEILCGQAPLLGAMKEIWAYLAAKFDTSGKSLKKIQRARNTGEYRDAVEEIFNNA
jgi:tRNA-dihydrouridine synthase